MSNISELKDEVDTKTINLVLLTIATGGIYLILWLNENYKIIDRVTKTKTADHAYIVWVAVCSGLSSMISGTGEETANFVAFMLAIAYTVLCVVWAFRARKSLQEYCLNEFKIDLKMNGFYTFLFNVYYINYCINYLPEAHRKQQILTGRITN